MVCVRNLEDYANSGEPPFGIRAATWHQSRDGQGADGSEQPATSRRPRYWSFSNDALHWDGAARKAPSAKRKAAIASCTPAGLKRRDAAEWGGRSFAPDSA